MSKFNADLGAKVTAAYAQNEVKAIKARRTNPAKKAAVKVESAIQDKLAGYRDACARAESHIRAAELAGVSAQIQIITKITDRGELGYKVQGIRSAGVRGKAESSTNAQNIFTIVNSQNRQLESMTAYLWAVRNMAHPEVLASLAPMAQNHEAVQAAMLPITFTDTKNVKRAGFVAAVSAAMVATVWAK